MPPAGVGHAGERGRAVPRSVAELARRLSAERKVAQLFLFGFRGTDSTAEIFGRLRRLDLGGIVLVVVRTTSSSGQLGALAGEAAVIAKRERHVPPWVLASQEGGELNSFPDLPPSPPPADIRSAGEAGAAGRATRRRNLRALGVNGVLGPVVDVGGGRPARRSARGSTRTTPRRWPTYADAVVRAYRDEHVFSSAAHFPGIGAADQSTQDGPATVGLGLDELRERDLLPFEAAISAGAPGRAGRHGAVPVQRLHRARRRCRGSWTPTLLRRDLRFKGVALTDDLADPAIRTLHTVPDAAVLAIRAGADMLYISGGTGDQQAAYAAVLRAVQRGRIPRRRLDQAIGRILLAKQDYDLLRR